MNGFPISITSNPSRSYRRLARGLAGTTESVTGRPLVTACSMTFLTVSASSRWRPLAIPTWSLPPSLERSESKKPEKLVTTHVATMADAHDFGKLVRVEAERRGLRQAEEAIFMGDCGNWLDPLREREFPALPRIAHLGIPGKPRL